MKQQIAKKWIQALKSGAYIQGQGKLKRLNKDESGFEHCCLGVLCELAVQEGIIQSRPSEGGNPWCSFGEKEQVHMTNFLPEAVVKWAGLTSKTGKTVQKINKTWVSLAQANDGGLSFQRIANVIGYRWRTL